jgi:hypothetical protein
MGVATAVLRAAVEQETGQRVINGRTGTYAAAMRADAAREVSADTSEVSTDVSEVSTDVSEAPRRRCMTERSVMGEGRCMTERSVMGAGMPPDSSLRSGL